MFAIAKSQATTAKGRRDLALIRLCHDLVEAVNPDLDDVDFIGNCIRLSRKANSPPLQLTLPQSARAALATWIDARGR
jgi:hypothetical protein